MHGARISLGVGVAAVLCGILIGAPLGLLAGYFRGWTDRLVSQYANIMLAFPDFLLALTIVFVLGPNMRNVVIAIGIAASPTYVRLVRGSVMQVSELPHVEAARAIGSKDARILLRHILPNVVSPVIIVGTLGLGSAILAAAALSFLGAGVQPPTAEWGVMLSEGRAYMRSAWWLTTIPGLVILVAVLAINLVGDGLRDALDPRR
jgi:peptide/nickel transport system permease protein